MASVTSELALRCMNYTAAQFARFGYVERRPLTSTLGSCFLTKRSYQSQPHTFSGCVHDSGGSVIPSTLRYNAFDIVPSNPVVLPSSRMAAAVREEKCGFYGGILFPILGHFLVETLGNFWMQALGAFPFKKDMIYYFHGWPGLDIEAFWKNPLYRLSLNAIGVTQDNLRLIEQDIALESLWLVERAAIYHEYVHPVMSQVFDLIAETVCAENASAKGRSIFLSRSAWQDNPRVENEAQIDSVFAALGFDIVHPQNLQPNELIGMLRSAERVATIDGSQAHLVAFCRPGTCVVLLDTRIVPTQIALERLRALRAVHIPLHDIAVIFDAEHKKVINIPGLITLVNDVIAMIEGSLD